MDDVVRVEVEFGARLATPSRWRVRMEGLVGRPVHCSAVKAWAMDELSAVDKVTQARLRKMVFIVGKNW
jgi:hypothetical protein